MIFFLFMNSNLMLTPYLLLTISPSESTETIMGSRLLLKNIGSAILIPIMEKIINQTCILQKEQDCLDRQQSPSACLINNADQFSYYFISGLLIQQLLFLTIITVIGCFQVGNVIFLLISSISNIIFDKRNSNQIKNGFNMLTNEFIKI